MQTVLPGFSLPPLPEDYSGQFRSDGKVIPYQVTWSREVKKLQYSYSDTGFLLIIVPPEMEADDIARILEKESGRIHRFIISERDRRRSVLSSGVFQVHDIIVPYSVVFNNRRRVNSVCYYRDGKLEIQARSDATPDHVREILEKQRDWIYSQVLRYDPRFCRNTEEESIMIGDERIPYLIKYSSRAKRLTIRISLMKPITVVAPYDYNRESIKQFIQSNRDWIAEKLNLDFRKPADPSNIQFMEYEGYRIPYHIRISKRAKRLTLRITAENRIEVVIPPRTEPELVSRFVNDNAGWIIKHVTSAARSVAPVRQYLDGEMLPLLGTVLRLSIVTGSGRPSAEVKDGVIRVNIPDSLPVSQHRGAVKQVYTHLLQQILDDIASPLMKSWSARIGIPVPVVRYGNQKTKWGVCSPRGIILNIRLAMGPPDLIEYVIIHELCHVRHPNHSKRFWSLVESVLPDFHDRKARLRKEGPLFSL